MLVCFTRPASSPSCRWPLYLGECQTLIHPSINWPTVPNPQQNIKHHSIAQLGSLSQKQIKGVIVFSFQLIWKCHIVSNRTSVLFMSNILLLLTAWYRPGGALTRLPWSHRTAVPCTANAIVLFKKQKHTFVKTSKEKSQKWILLFLLWHKSFSVLQHQ